MSVIGYKAEHLKNNTANIICIWMTGIVIFFTFKYPLGTKIPKRQMNYSEVKHVKVCQTLCYSWLCVAPTALHILLLHPKSRNECMRFILTRSMFIVAWAWRVFAERLLLKNGQLKQYCSFNIWRGHFLKVQEQKLTI